MSEQNILIVEDDPKIRSLLRNVLEDDGFVVYEAQSSAGAMDVLSRIVVSLITLDVHLGTDNGIEVARDIRRTSQVPIIMVTGKDDVIDRVVGLEVGADDYITKPFHVRELTARIRTVLRRAQNTSMTDVTDPNTAQRGEGEAGLRYHFDGMTAVPDLMELMDRDRKDSCLTSGDFKLLMVFLERPKRVLSRDQLMDLTGGAQWNPLDRAIDNQVARLRKKIERDPSNPKLIKTVRGVGYTLACDVDRQDTPPAKSA